MHCLNQAHGYECLGREIGWRRLMRTIELGAHHATAGENQLHVLVAGLAFTLEYQV